jgi:glycosyltransferase involved in cell wall biosynthesis
MNPAHPRENAAVHQLIAGAGVGDAITNYALEIQGIVRRSNRDSLVFAPGAHIAVDLRKKGAVAPASEMERTVRPGDLLIYHYSIGSRATDRYRGIRCRKMLCYHNITPSRYFSTLSPRQKKALDEGRAVLRRLSDETPLACAVSKYNEAELRELGFRETAVIPLVFPQAYLKTPPYPPFLKRFHDGIFNILFVGRVVPNKRFEDLIKAFYFFHHTVRPQSRLILVGSYVGNEKYYTFLKSLVFDLGMTGSVVFTGHVTNAQLIACYRSAGAFLCLSEHEGVGLPLVEAMHFGVPVFALDRAAVSETLGGAGVLIREAGPREIAELIHAVTSRPRIVKAILERQEERRRDFTARTLEKRIGEILEPAFGIRLSSEENGVRGGRGG